MKRIQTYVSDDTHEAVKTLADGEGRTVSNYLSRLIDAHLAELTNGGSSE